MKKVLVTGAGGFIGREVLRCLAKTGAVVVALDARLDGLAASDRLILVQGDLADAGARSQAIGAGVDAVIHLAAVPGGAAEQDPGSSKHVNIDGTLDLLSALVSSNHKPRFVFASTIAVYGDPLPAQGVDDTTPLKPRMIYGAHKAMIETMIATLSRRGNLDGVSLRLPGIVARPKGPSGMKSAFMSNLFHALNERQAFVSPVSPQGTMWLMSVTQCATNLVKALTMETALFPEGRALALPAQCITMGSLAGTVAQQCRMDAGAVTYAPDAALEAGFAAHPPLSTPAAQVAGFAHDGDVATLVARALDVVRRA
jgi:D-erythronate 2-dehydrogenase